MLKKRHLSLALRPRCKHSCLLQDSRHVRSRQAVTLRSLMQAPDCRRMLGAGHVAALASVIEGRSLADRMCLSGRLLLRATGLFSLR